MELSNLACFPHGIIYVILLVQVWNYLTLPASPIVLLYPPYPKDRGMLWFYVEAARRPPSAARRPPPATRRPPPAMVLTR